jgi:flagellar basal-body rod modification protein FlgD
MMAFSAIDAGTAVGATQSKGMSQQDFIKILMTQMTYQDPLKPMDNEQFMAQMAQFTALQQTTDLNANLVQLIQNQAALSSVGLLGRSVDITTASGSTTGTVTGLSYSGNLPVMTVKTAAGDSLPNVSLSQLVNVR